MKEKLSIKVSVAGRIYPLTIERHEEESVRKAAKLVNDKVTDYEQNYNIKDRQDLLAMTALNFASQYALEKESTHQDDKNLIERLEKLDKLVSRELEKA